MRINEPMEGSFTITDTSGINKLIESMKKESKMVEDKMIAFMDELERRGITVSGETCFICNDGAVLFSPNDKGGVDLILVRHPVKLDYSLGITDSDIELWRGTGELIEALGGKDNGGD